LNKAIATPPNSSLPQLDTCWSDLDPLPWSVLQLKLRNILLPSTKIKPFKLQIFAHCRNIFNTFPFSHLCANDSILQVRPHLFIVCAEIASAAAVYTVHLWLGWLVQMQFIHTRTLTKGERKRIWSKAAV
jgi:hypothetical protein